MTNQIPILTPKTVLHRRYRIKSVLSTSGGMGVLYIAEDVKLANRICVVKELLTDEDPTLHKENVQAFQREAQVMVKRDHIHMLELFDFFEENGRHYMIIEYIDGIDLEKKLENNNNKPLNELQVVEWTIPVCKILYHLHIGKPPVVHRDIKPGNIMILSDNSVKVIDFGISRFGFKKGDDLGTPGYAPPEQYKGEANPKSDIFALGATLHHLLTGRDPRDHKPFTFPEPHTLNPKISTPLNNLIMKCLQKDTKKRPQSAKEVEKELIKIRNFLLIKQFIPKSKFGLGMFIGLILGIILGVVGFFLYTNYF